MRVSNHRLRVLGFAMVMSLLASITAVPIALADDQEFDMNDRFATQTFPGGGGSGEVEVEDGSVEFEIEAENFPPNHAFELKVTIDLTSVVTFGPILSDEDGDLEIEDALTGLAPGTYRLDFFVTHTHSTVEGSGEFGPFLTGLFDRDPLLSCQPAVNVTIDGDDDDDDDDDDGDDD